MHSNISLIGNIFFNRAGGFVDQPPRKTEVQHDGLFHLRIPKFDTAGIVAIVSAGCVGDC